MGHRSPKLILCVLLICGNAALAWQIYREVRSSPVEPRIAKAVVQKSTTPQVMSIAKFVMPQEDRFIAIVERPLFSPSRRPPPGIDTPTGQGNEIHAILSGIVHDNAARLILLRPEASDELLLLREGQAFDGWTLSQVERERAVFRSGDREAVLELVFGRDTDPIPETENRKQ